MKILVFMAAALLLTAPAVHAGSPPAFILQPSVVDLDPGQQLLHLIIEDSSPHSGVCDYTVSEFDYFRDLKWVFIRLDRAPCLNDYFGPSSADVYWRLPEELQIPGARVCVSVNDESPVELVYDGHGRETVGGQGECP